jgi:hypothetical protein
MPVRNAYGQTTSTIGTGGGRTYNTIGDWESMVTGANEIGEGYDDGALNEQVALNNTNCTTQMRLTAETNERHDGTAGSGFRIERSVGQFNNLTTTINTVGPEIEVLVLGLDSCHIYITALFMTCRCQVGCVKVLIVP